MSSDLKHGWNTLKSMIFGSLCFMAMLYNAGPIRAQEIQVSDVRAVPEALVYVEAAVDAHPGMSFAVIVDKHHQQANLYRYDGYWRAVAKWPCSTGKLAGPKQAEGDHRTPEGVYFAIRNVGPRFLTPTYGARALPLDYPNWLDRHMSRSGSAIWLHGTNKPLQARDSNGCIVLENKAIENLAPYVRLNRTPVIIVDRLRLQALKEARPVADAILDTAGKWHDAMMQGSYEDFKEFYAPHAAPSMQWWQKWCRQRRGANRIKGFSSLMSQRAIYKCGSDGRYVLLFDHVLTASTQSRWVGRRKLYLMLDGYGVRIVGDTYQTTPGQSHYPLLQAWRLFHKTKDRDKQVAIIDKKEQSNYAVE